MKRLMSCIATALALSSTTSAHAAKVDVPLPPDLATKGTLTVGINCAYPPAGFIGIDGKPGGYEYIIVKDIAEYAFGSGDKLQTQCVNDSNRISFLQSRKIDLLLASLAWTAARAEQLDYSSPIWLSNLQLVVPKESAVGNYADLDSKTVVTTTGSTYQTWLQNCYPKANLVTAQTPAEAATMLTQNRADAFAYIDVYDFNFVQQHKQYKVVGSLAASAVQGVGVKKDNKAMLTWINAVLEQLRQKDAFFQAFSEQVKDPAFAGKYRNVVPGPNVKVSYPTSKELVCKVA